MGETTTATDRGKLTVGLDVGDRYTQICVLDEDGEVLEEGLLSEVYHHPIEVVFHPRTGALLVMPRR